MKIFRAHILLCGGTACRASGSEAIHKALIDELTKKKLSEEVRVVETGCNGFCAAGPIMVIYPEGTFYQHVTCQDIPEIINEHIIKGRIVERLLYREPDTLQAIPHIQDIAFFGKQRLIALKNRGMIDAEKIDEYISRDGYMGAGKALTEMTPDKVIEEITKSGLRGRGGGGFPTGMKWSFARKAEGPQKYILCNADEGDPGAFMDRSILESDPHSVLEGMIIAGYAIGADKGYIYCRAEYPLAVKRLNLAIKQANDYGLLGSNILGSDYSLEIDVYQGAGAFVCGEETALMASIEGKRGMPRPRPPFPAQKGLFGKPSVLNNVETFANVSQIILKGGEWYSSIGTKNSKGTKVFALTGAVNNVGLVEVPMGTPIGDIIFDIGGGIPNGKKFKAAQLGGPSGGCIPASALNVPTDYEEIIKVGAIMGSGGLIVMDEDTCMVDTARFFMEFCQEESCGKCTPCREGTKRMLEILERICNGQGRKGDIELLEDLADSIKDSALCGLGQTAPNPVLSTLRYFRNEYESHIFEKKCFAAVCSGLFKSPCQHTCPIGMDVPAYIALVRAGRLSDAYKVLKRTNPFPAVCGRVCPQFCASKCRRSQLDEPMAIAGLKRYITDNAEPPKAEKVPVTRKEKIAVIGAGPCGLTAAQDLAKRGYAVTVFEELPLAGGMMRYGIPEYRLPREVIEKEVRDIISLGVELKTNTRAGKDITHDELRKSFDITVIATGAHKSWNLGIEGEDLKGVYGAVEFLRDVNLGKKTDVGRQSVVIGGGNTAIDAARTALRLGAEVTILYRRQRKDMPAWEFEIEAAEEEGIKIEYLKAPVRVIGEKASVVGIEVETMALAEFDNSGRRRAKPLEGSRYVLSTDSVIAAISQSSDNSWIPADSDISISKSGSFKLNPVTKTSTTAEGVFAGGDAVLGPATVVEAIEAGHNIAMEADSYIRLKNSEPPYKAASEEEIEVPFEVDEDTEEQARAKLPEADVGSRIVDFREVELCFSAEQAFKEACRCMRCDGENS